MSRDRLVCAVFDVDGTLIDSLYNIIKAVELCFKENSLSVPDAGMIRSGIGLSLEEAIKRLAPDIKSNQLQKIMVDFEKAVFKIRTSANYPDPLYEGALNCLSQLEEQDILLAIATGNSKKGLDNVLKVHNLQKRFISCMTADICASKPNPQMLNEIMKQTGVEANNLYMIGDTIYDIAMGKKAEAKTIGVSWGYHDKEVLKEAGADYIIDSFEEILKIIESEDY